MLSHTTYYLMQASDVEAVAREVKQYHYLGWPDHGMPEYPTSMVAFTKYVTDNAPPKPGPIVVHCRYNTSFYHKLYSFLKTFLILAITIFKH